MNFQECKKLSLSIFFNYWAYFLLLSIIKNEAFGMNPAPTHFNVVKLVVNSNQLISDFGHAPVEHNCEEKYPRNNSPVQSLCEEGEFSVSSDSIENADGKRKELLEYILKQETLPKCLKHFEELANFYESKCLNTYQCDILQINDLLNKLWRRYNVRPLIDKIEEVNLLTFNPMANKKNVNIVTKDGIVEVLYNGLKLKIINNNFVIDSPSEKPKESFLALLSEVQLPEKSREELNQKLLPFYDNLPLQFKKSPLNKNYFDSLVDFSMDYCVKVENCNFQEANQNFLTLWENYSALIIPKQQIASRTHTTINGKKYDLLAAGDKLILTLRNNPLGNGSFNTVYPKLILTKIEGFLKVIPSVELRPSNEKSVESADFINERKVFKLLEGKEIINLARAEEIHYRNHIPGNASSGSMLLEKRYDSDLTRIADNKKQQLLPQIINGLTELHNLQMVHGDLKFANVLYNKKEEEAVIADFGHTANPNESIATRGTPYFEAPEMVNQVNLKSVPPHEISLVQKRDIFAFGIMALWTLKGQQGNSLAFHCRKFHAKVLGFTQEYRNCINGIKDKFYSQVKILAGNICQNKGDSDTDCVVAKIAALCVNDNPSERPSAEEIKEYFRNPATIKGN